MLAPVFRASARNDPSGSGPLADMFQLRPADACDFADAGASQEGQAQCDSCPSRSRRLNNARPEQLDFIVRQNAPTYSLNTALFQAMAGVGLDNGGIHPECKNRAHQGLNAVR